MYYVARWYDPVLGRFAQADSIVPGAGNPMAWDRYAYALNSPLNFIDPSGHIACEDLGTETCDSSGNYVNDSKIIYHKSFLQPLASLWVSGYDYLGHPSHFGVDYGPSGDNTVVASGSGTLIASDSCTYSQETNCVYYNGPDDKVSDSTTNFGYGNTVIVEYAYDDLADSVIEAANLSPGESLYILYAHLNEPSLLSPGDVVSPGDMIGTVGTTGNSTGDHLHLEARIAETGSISPGTLRGDYYRDWWSMSKINPHSLPFDQYFVRERLTFTNGAQ